MKIYIAPTIGNIDGGEILHHSATTEIDDDCLSCDRALEMCVNTLIAFGYHPDNIKELLDKEFASSISALMGNREGKSEGMDNTSTESGWDA